MTQRYPIAGEYNPTVPSRIIFGQGKADTLAAEVEALGGPTPRLKERQE